MTRYDSDLLAEIEAWPPHLEKQWREQQAKKRRKTFKVIEDRKCSQ